MRVCNHVHQIRIDFNITAHIKRYVYVYLITGKFCYLIDSGVSGSEHIIKEYMNKLGRDIEEIKTIFLTHSHPDHLGGAAAIQERSGCQIVAGERERKWMEDIDCQFRERPIPGFYNLLNSAVIIDDSAFEGSVFSLEEGLTLEAIETPGHSAGSVSYILRTPQSDIAFIGDTVPVPGDIPIFTQPQQSIRSIKILADLPRVRWYCPAWDKEYTREEFKLAAEDGIMLIDGIIKAADQVRREHFHSDEDEQVTLVCQKLGVESENVNPLFMKSILSCLKR